MLKNFLDMLYPRRCPLCHKILKNSGTFLCEECRSKAVPAGSPRCFRCGRPVQESEEYCLVCRKYPAVFDEGRGIFPYSEMWQSSITRFKYYGCREYGDFFAKAMCVYGGKELKRWNPDVIVPVPMHRRKQRMRGFNQAAYLGTCISRITGIPMEENLVFKVKHTKSQKKLDASQRRQNLKDAFEGQRRIDGAKILVVDDVYTTGSTMNAMAACLRKNGAERVYFLTLCIGRVN